MTDIFLRLLNVSITAVYIVVAVLILRLCLKKAPKWISCTLWGVLGLRLLLPISFASPLSLIPSAQTVPGNIADAATPQIYSGIPQVDALVNPAIGQSLAPQGATMTPMELLLRTATVLWLAGLAVMLVFCIWSYFRLYRKVRTSVCCQKNVYCCDYIDTPFILGILSPKIYLPSGLAPEESDYVMAHERAHLKRKDHWWKPFGFVVLTVYWFNPLLWVAYILLSRDIESACDQRAIKAMTQQEKKAYAEALAFCGNHRKMISACPLAFGEVGVKDRIKTVLHYKKPTVWLLGAGVVALLVLSLCFLTDPPPCEHAYVEQVVTQPTCTQTGIKTHTCTACGDSYREDIPQIEHHYAEAVTVQAPTCTQTGKKAYICSHCHAVQTQSINRLEHSFSQFTQTKASSCGIAGEETAVCTLCGEAVTRAVASTGEHILQNTMTRAPTCTDHGEGVDICTVCGYTKSCKYPLALCSYGTPQTILQATCTREGQSQYTCTVCGSTKTEVIPTVGHSWSGGNCTAPATCTVCKQVDPRGPIHQYELLSDRGPTNFDLGKRTYQCICKDRFEEYYDRNGTYDLDYVEQVLTDYAAELGFRVLYSHNLNAEIAYSRRVGVANTSFFGGQDYLIEYGKQMLDAEAEKITDRWAHTLWIVVSYRSRNYLMGFDFDVYMR